MKKSTIIFLGVIMGLSFASLLLLQMRYIEEIISTRREHFEESVSRSLYETAHQLELSEAKRYLEQGSEALNGIATATDSVFVSTDSSVIQRTHQVTAKDGSVFTSRETTASTNLSDKYFTKKMAGNSDRQRSLQEIMAMRYATEKNLVEEVIYSILYTASDRPLAERIDFSELDQELKVQLSNNGIDIPYHFSVSTSNGQNIYQCADYESTGSENTFTETLFKNDPVQRSGILKVHFPAFSKYVWRSLWFMIPSLIFTLILLITFIVTLVLVFRQKKLTELKNDFINNMTHEFKTPISSISLAAQMLGDDSIKKTPALMERLTTTIIDETKRLRFQVEKVLQLSMYANQQANLHMKEVDMNELIAGVSHTFALKVEKNGGKIITNLNAEDPVVCVDDMHFTNVIFNLMDNAVKYRRKDADLELNVETWNEPGLLCISIKDNGIGIKKEDLKRIFEKFYRVHTGNLHDVKGFGLGLAYVHKIVKDHKGTIVAESEPGIGTKFIIKLKMNE
ncbi:MAG: two-component sensor histidine kinase [Bacteroidaceae bacterium]|nr:two-component sensor histidine kinase [Bacteroidaceae bacterium]MBR1519614.1 two-component sensor histidine kinase [Bacteroidaceae bacterium]